jgi:hypothetical protein
MPSTYTPIATTTLGSSQSTVTFSSISGSYTDLHLVCNSANATTGAFLYLRFNSDSGSNYSYTELWGDGSTDTSTRYTNMNLLFNADVSMETSFNYNAIIDIFNYSNTTTFKTAVGRLNRATSSGYTGALALTGCWRSTSAITSITIASIMSGTGYDFAAGSSFTLFGIKAA